MESRARSRWWPANPKRLFGSSILLLILIAVYVGLWIDNNGLIAKDTTHYGTHGQAVDVYRSRLSLPFHPRPAVLLIHGGGWMFGDRNEFTHLGYWLARKGMVAAAIDYRLTPSGATWPAQAIDVEEAMWWLREHARELNIDPNHVVAIGTSAGGHLAGWLGTSDEIDAQGTHSRANQVASLWGPWDLTVSLPLWHPAMQQGIRQLLGTQSARSASPLFFVNDQSAPTLFVHGTEDHVIDPDQSTRACNALRAANVACEIMILRGEGHGFGSNDEARVDAVYGRLVLFIELHEEAMVTTTQNGIGF